jgi:hypothetical protein
MNRRTGLCVVLAGLLAGCQSGAGALTAAGVAPATAATIATDTAVAGQLFCMFGPTLIAVAGVNVKGASAPAVANACALAQVAGMLTPPTPPKPVAAPSGAVAVVATVPAPTAAAVAASVGT